MPESIRDHQGRLAEHGRAVVNGVRLHHVKAGSGDPVILLHGVPKTHYHWRFLIPLLAPRYTVIAPDLRGLGNSQHAAIGYDMRTMAEDIAQLATHLGHERFYLAGEDWGASAAYQLAANYPDKVRKLVYQENYLPGFGLVEHTILAEENVQSYHWPWHASFYNVPDFPEFLIAGRERACFTYFIRHECHDPTAISEDSLAILEDGRQNRESGKRRLKMPVLAVGSKYFIGADNERQMREVAEDVRGVVLPHGHQLAEECPSLLATEYLKFFAA